MKVGKVPFDKIVEGLKKIESRIFDEKRQKICIGDEIEFSENDKPENTHIVEVIGLLNYKLFSDLFTDQIQLFGWDTKEFLENEIYTFLSPEKEAKYWVLGIRIKSID